MIKYIVLVSSNNNLYFIFDGTNCLLIGKVLNVMNQYLTIERKNDQYPVNIIRRGLLKHGKNIKLKELHHAYKVYSIEMEKLKRIGKTIPKAGIVIQQDE